MEQLVLLQFILRVNTEKMRISQTQFFGTWFLELSKQSDGFKYQSLHSLEF
jgi:hypothetical protein